MADLMTVGAGGAKAGAGFLGRGVGLVFTKVMRVRQIDDTLRGRAKASASTRTVLSDYQTYLAATSGQYGVDVRDFHNELMRSGVLDAMIELAITNRESRAVRQSFETIFSRFLDDQHDHDRIYADMMVAFRTSIAALSKDQSSSRLISAFSKQINDRLDQIEDSFSQRSWEPLPLNADELISSIISGLHTHYKTLKVETIGGVARDVDIADIYVPPSLRLLSDRRRLAAVAEALPPHIVKRLSVDSYGRTPSPDPVRPLISYTYPEIRDSFRRVVVLGDPGGGKSTLCQRVCFDLARASHLAQQFAGKNYVSPEEQRVPFRVILRLFEQARVSEPQLDLITYIARDLRQHVAASDDEIRSVLIYLLRSGRAVLAFDGLDEILDTANRRTYVDLVTALCNQFPLTPVLVTSRFVGYESAPLPRDFDKVILQRFRDDEVGNYAFKFMTFIGDKTDKEAKADQEKFLLQTKDNADDLRRNPLMLGLMLWIFLVKRDVPSNRPGIYAECSNLMFDKWDSNRGIRPKLPKFDRAQLFSNIAAKVYPDRNLRAGVSRDWLIEELKSYFAIKFVNASDAEEAAESLTEFLVGRAWVMMEVGEGVFAFTHQTFMEYFYARHVVGQHDTVKGLFRVVRKNISQKERDVVNHLSLQIKTNGNDRLKEEAIKEILDYRRRLTKPESASAVLQYAAKSLEYLVPSQSCVRLIIEDVYEFALSGAKGGVHILSTAQSSGNLERDFISAEFVRLFTSDISGKDDLRAESALRLLISAARSRWSGAALDSQLPLSEVVAVVKSHVAARAESNSFWAHAAWVLMARLEADWIRRYGLQEYLDAELVTGFEYLSSVDGIALGLTEGYKQYYVKGSITKAALERALTIWGEVGFEVAEKGPLNIRRQPHHIDVPYSVWIDLFEGLSDSPELFKGAAFSYVSFVENELVQARTGSRDEEQPKIKKIFRTFARTHEQWAGMTPAFRAVLMGERSLLTSVRLA